MVDDFCVKVLVKEHALHLKAELEIKYKVTTDWEGNLYIVIALKWDYETVTVQLSMPGYVHVALHASQHEKPKRLQESQYSWTQPIYGKNNNILS